MLRYTQRPEKSKEVYDLSDLDLSGILHYEGDFLTEGSLPSSALRNVAKNVVFISSDRNKPHGSGVVVNHNGQKYLVTATHILGSKCFGKPTDLKVFERNGDNIVAAHLEDVAMLYSTPQARERKLPAADVGVFEYKGNLEGVQLHHPMNADTYVAIALGYPGIHADKWLGDLKPLASSGKAIVQEKRKKELTPYMQKLLAEHGMLDAPESVQKIIFTGATSGGNSGGGLFTLEGKLLGVCRGPNGTIGKETGVKDFEPVIEVLEAIQK